MACLDRVCVCVFGRGGEAWGPFEQVARLTSHTEGYYTCARQVPHAPQIGIILFNRRNSETCNKKEKPPFYDHLEYLLVQKLLSGWG